MIRSPSAGSIALVSMLALTACGTPVEPSADDLLTRLTAGGSASFALAALEDPAGAASQQGAVILRTDLACSAGGASLQSMTTDTVVLHSNGRAERIYRMSYANTAGEVFLSSRAVFAGTWERYAPLATFHYSSGPSIRLIMTMESAAAPTEIYFRVHSPTEISTHTGIASVHHCPNNPAPGHSIIHQGFLRYERF